jgi:hypothetical protein
MKHLTLLSFTLLLTFAALATAARAWGYTRPGDLLALRSNRSGMMSIYIMDMPTGFLRQVSPPGGMPSIWRGVLMDGGRLRPTGKANTIFMSSIFPPIRDYLHKTPKSSIS